MTTIVIKDKSDLINCRSRISRSLRSWAICLVAVFRILFIASTYWDSSTKKANFHLSFSLDCDPKYCWCCCVECCCGHLGAVGSPAMPIEVVIAGKYDPENIAHDRKGETIAPQHVPAFLRICAGSGSKMAQCAIGRLNNFVFLINWTKERQRVWKGSLADDNLQYVQCIFLLCYSLF